MIKEYRRRSVTRLLCTMVLSSALLACGIVTPPQIAPPQAVPEAFSTIDQPAQHYQQQAKRAADDDRFAWQAMAIRAYLQQEELAEAERLLSTLAPDSLSPAQQEIARLLLAAWAVAADKLALAEQQLHELDKARLPVAGQPLLLSTQGRLLEKQAQPLAAARQYIALHQYLSGSEAEQNREHVYRLLSEPSSSTLRNAQQSEEHELTRGWFALMAIVNDPDLSPGSRQWQLDAWSRMYPSHPGAIHVPSMPDLPISRDYQPAHIAILLPLGGQLAEQAEAIRAGMMHAHQASDVQLSFIDTHAQDMATVYRQAQRVGADFIVGPLLKENVEALLALMPTLPVLALNAPALKPTLPHAYYFSLSPEDEATEVARHLWELGHQQPLVFAPDHELGRRIANQFNQSWQQQSGRPATLGYFSDKDKIEDDVRQALAGTQTNTTMPTPAQEQAPTLSHEPVDALFLATNAIETQVTLPFFHLVQDSQGKPRLPTYVISRSHVPEGTAVREFNGLQLADMPWMLNQLPQLKDEITVARPKASSSWLRLFAFGHDALTILPHLHRLRASHESLPALTGQLSVAPDGILLRELLWVTYQDGNWLPAGQ